MSRSLVVDHLPIRDVLRFWRDIEFFLPFQFDDLYDRYDTIIELKRGSDQPLPWNSFAHYELNPEFEYGFDLFLGVFALTEVTDALSARLRIVRPDRTPEYRQLEGRSCLLRVAFNEQGQCDPDDLSLSTLPWAVARYRSHGSVSLTDFDTFAQSVYNDLRSLRKTDAETRESVTPADLDRIADLLTEGHPMRFFPDDLIGAFVPYRLRKRKRAEPAVSDQDRSTSEQKIVASAPALRSFRKVDILNSFYLRDIERVFRVISDGDLPEGPLARYLGQDPLTKREIGDSSGRQWVDARLRELDPPDARWPRSSAAPLVKHQRLALATYLEPERRLLAVNGPPGTGKTTLVRELTAYLVVERAKALSRCTKPADALEKSWRYGKVGQREVRYRPVCSEIGGFELIVASNNNAAVENISLELPKRTTCSDQYGPISYLEPTARLYAALREENTLDLDGECNARPEAVWGLPSVALGNQARRRLFRRAAFDLAYEEDDETRKRRVAQGRFLTLSEWRNRAVDGAVSFAEAKRRFRAKCTELERSQVESRGSPTPNGSEGDLPWYFDPPSAEKDPLLVRLRSELFLAALTLHEAWIREMPRFDIELSALAQLLRNPSAVSEEDAANLWRILFLVVPVVSTTLASVERMFAPVAPGSFGHAVIEEAGQATPQSAIGILLRSKKVLVIGDQRQLEPVSVTPDDLERTLAVDLPSDVRTLVTPTVSSVQTMADRVTEIGRSISDNAGGEIWLGLPLCVHRRCASPMFELANAIAYDGLMIQAADRSPSHPRLGSSCWWHVSGPTSSKQWVPAQGDVVVRLVLQLLQSGDGCPDLFCLSPFREVKSRLRSMIRKELKQRGYDRDLVRQISSRIGTVHTFQGKEAEIVIFVLGCDHASAGAADWAGEKPNLVNVAITRAKDLLYVVGDVNLWHNRGYFSDLEKALVKRGVGELQDDALRRVLAAQDEPT